MPRTSISATLIVLVMQALWVASGGCTRAEDVRETTTVRDSAGVRITESATPLLPVGSWTISKDPVSEIGGGDTDEMQNLYRVAGALGLSDGRVVVGNGPAPMLRWYDSTGAYLMGTGRPGGGPGEFGGGEGAWIAEFWPLQGDSVATWEHSARRMQVFGPEGDFVRAVILDLPDDMPARSYPQIVGYSADGFVAFLLTPMEPGALGEKRRDDLTFLRYHADGSYEGRLASLPGFEAFTIEINIPGRPEPIRTEGRPPFSKPPAMWVHDDSFIYGSADRYEILVFGLDGGLKSIIRKLVPNRPFTSAIRDAYIASIDSTIEANPGTARPRTDPRDMPYPDSLPAYRRFRVDRIGFLWVQDYALSADSVATWSIFNPNGRWVTDVVIPQTWQVEDIGDDYIVVVTMDDLDVEHVAKYRLSRSQGDSATGL